MSVTPVRRLAARLVPFDWTWATRERDAIAAHWAERQALTPTIFNGRVLMVCGLRFAPGSCDADLFETDYANLIAWIDGGCPGGEGVANGFAMGALQAADGAYVLGRMGPHTANAGRLYFPCGTPDRTDVRPDGIVDLAGSLVREIAEETGFTPPEVAVDADWLVVRAGGLVAFMRRVRLPVGGDEARSRILAKLAAEARPELCGVQLVRGLADLEGEHRMPGVVPLYLQHALGTSRISSGSEPGGCRP